MHLVSSCWSLTLNLGRPKKLEKARARVERALARRKDARDAYRAKQERTAEE